MYMNGHKKNIQLGPIVLVEVTSTSMRVATIQQLIVTIMVMRVLRTTTAHGFRISFFVALDYGSDA